MILALDQGTTSSRAIVFDRRGNPLAVSQKEITQHYPEPGWVEHDPHEIWSTQLEAARQAILMAGATGRIDAIGITNQREMTLLWDRETGKPVHRAIVWQDRRTADRCTQLKSAGHEEAITAQTGLIADSYFSGTKLAWLLDNIPGVRADAEAGRLAFGTIDSFLIWRLTGGRVHVTDFTNACRTMLFDIHRMDWSPDLLDLLRIPRSVLPTVVASSGVVGYTEPEVFGASIPISGIAGDQQAATFGQACFHPGMAKSTYGTGCFILMNTGLDPKVSTNRLLSTLAASSGRQTVYALEGSVFVAGAAVQWLRDEMGLIRYSSEVEEVAASIPDSGGIYVVPAFTGLGAPHWDSYARGAVFGLTRGTGRRHLVRATLESIAFQCRDVLDAMALDNGGPLREIRVDGGAANNDLLMQFQADILGIPVVRPKFTETTGLGAAYLAGLAVGFWESMNDIESQWCIDRTFVPVMADDRRRELYAGWQDAVSRTRGEK
jgi:glycerol kinase